MNKKGRWGLWVISFLVIILLIAVIVAIIFIANQKNTSQTSEETQIRLIDVFIKSKDNFNSYFNGNYYILQEGSAITYSGTTNSDSFSEISLPEHANYQIYCSGDKYYTERTRKSFTSRDLEFNKTSIECTGSRMGELKIETISGNIQSEDSIISLNLTCFGGECRRLNVCFSWTVGIKNAKPIESRLICDEGSWKNFTSCDDTSCSYLPQNQFLCGEYTQKCSSVKDNFCEPELSIPSRFKSKMDECYPLGITLKNDQSYQLDFNVKTLSIKNSLDELNLIFYDSDRHFIGNKTEWITELNGKDYGNKDFEYKIKYQTE
jgi:hypothetical protein